MHSTQFGTAKYKYASNNTQLLDEHFTILHRQNDLERLRLLLDPQKVFEKLEQDFIKSYRIQVVDVFEVMVKIWHTRQPVGCKGSALAKLYADNKKHSLITFGAESATDDLCFFRCLAYHIKKKRRRIKKEATKLRAQAVRAQLMQRGAKIDVAKETYRIENLYKLNIQFYDQHGEIYDFLYSCKMHPSLLRILLIDGHCMVITDIFGFFGKHCCLVCNKFYGHKSTLSQHNCRGKQQHVPKIQFQGGVEKPMITLFEQLAAISVSVPHDLHYNRGFIAFDVECMLKQPEAKMYEERHEKNIIEEHVPCSIALAYSGDDASVNNPDYFESTGDCASLIANFVSKLIEIYRKHVDKQRETYREYLDRFEEHVAATEDIPKITPFNDNAAIAKLCTKKYAKLTNLERLRQQLYTFVFKLPVIGFNSSSYDLNVLREWLFPELLKHCKPAGKYSDLSILKRRNRYLCIETPHLKFLDAYLFVAAGTSLKSFMKSQGETESKLEFPYRYLTNLEVLRDTELPPLESWLVEDRQYRAETNVQRKAAMLDVAARRRQVAQDFWIANNLTTFGQYLRAYNTADVRPFVRAFKNFATLFKEQKYNVFNHVTLPSIAKEYGVRSSPAGSYFMRFDKNSQLAYEKIRNSLFGGVSMVWTRHVECGVSKIRPWEVKEAETVQSILGMYMSGCYLQASSEEHMTGPYFLRDSQTKFAITSRFADLNACLALEYTTFRRYGSVGVEKLQHKWKGGEKQIITSRAKVYHVDGYLEIGEETIILEFNGCYYHNHNPCKRRNKTKNKKHDPEREAERMSELRKRATTVIVIWECDWWDQHKRPEVQEFLRTRPMYATYESRDGMSAAEALRRVRAGKLKGLLEIDAYVPHAEAARFRDLNPFFYRAPVKWNMIGPVMQDLLCKHDRQFESREMLLNPPFCEKLLVPHQYVIYLLECRIVITKVHYIIEFPYASRPFEKLANEISLRRQEAASNPEKEAEGMRLKLIGNALYGTSITNPYDFTTTRFVSREQAERQLFQQAVCGFVQLNDEICEITVKKRTTVIRQPVQFGMVVYCLSKLRVLQFAMEWYRMLEYEKFAMILSDTDSLYICFARQTWEQCCHASVTEDAIEQFKKKWFALEESQSKQAGLWHCEFSGSLVIALAPKLYIAVSSDPGKVKLATRGISAKHNRLDVGMFREQLYASGKAPQIVTQSFRMMNDHMITWQFFPTSFTSFYIKREVLPDLINTAQLRWQCPAWVQWHDESRCNMIPNM